MAFERYNGTGTSSTKPFQRYLSPPTTKPPTPFTPEEEPNQTGVGGLLHNLIKGGGEMIGGVASLVTRGWNDIGQGVENVLEAVPGEWANADTAQDKALAASPQGEFALDDIAKNITGWDILNGGKPIESALVQDVKDRYQGLWKDEEGNLQFLGNLTGKEGVFSKAYDNPASVISDVLTVASGGAGAAAKGAGVAEKIGTIGRIGEEGAVLGKIAQGTQAIKDAAMLASETSAGASAAETAAKLASTVAEQSLTVRTISKIRGYADVNPGVWNDTLQTVEKGASSVNYYERLKSKLFLKVVSKPMAKTEELQAIIKSMEGDFSNIGASREAVERLNKQATAAARGVQNELRPAYANLKVKKLVDSLVGANKAESLGLKARFDASIVGKKYGKLPLFLKKSGIVGAENEAQLAIDALHNADSLFDAEVGAIPEDVIARATDDISYDPNVDTAALTHVSDNPLADADRAKTIVRGEVLPALQAKLGNSRVLSVGTDSSPALRVIEDGTYTGGATQVAQELRDAGATITNVSNDILSDGTVRIQAIANGAPFEVQVVTPNGHAVQQALSGPQKALSGLEKAAADRVAQQAELENLHVAEGTVDPAELDVPDAATLNENIANLAAEVDDRAKIASNARHAKDPSIPGVQAYDEAGKAKDAAAEAATGELSATYSHERMGELADLNNQVDEAKKALKAAEKADASQAKLEARLTHPAPKNVKKGEVAKADVGVAAVRQMERDRANLPDIPEWNKVPDAKAALDDIRARRDAVEAEIDADFTAQNEVARQSAVAGTPWPEKKTGAFFRAFEKQNKMEKLAAANEIHAKYAPRLKALREIQQARKKSEMAAYRVAEGQAYKNIILESIQHELRGLNPDTPKQAGLKELYDLQVAWGNVVSKQIGDGDLTLSDAMDRLYMRQRMDGTGRADDMSAVWDPKADNPSSATPGNFVHPDGQTHIPSALELDQARREAGIAPPTYFPEFDTNKIKAGDWMTTVPNNIRGIVQRTADDSLKHSEGELITGYLEARKAGDVTKAAMFTDPAGAYRLRIAKLIRAQQSLKHADNIIAKLGYEVDTHWDTETGRWTWTDVAPENGVIVSPDHLHMALNAKMEFEDRLLAAMADGEDVETAGARIWTEVGEDNINSLQRLMSDQTTKPPRLVVIPAVAAKRFDEYGKYQMPSSVRMAIDTPMNIWKQWVLTASPKWILNNTIGNAVFMGIGGGKVLDVAHYALSKKFREAIRRMNGSELMDSGGYFGDSSSYIAKAGTATDNRLIGWMAAKNADSKVTGLGRRWAGRMHKINEAVENASREVAFVNSMERAAFRDNLVNYNRTWMTSYKQLEELYRVGVDEKRVTIALDGANKMMNDYNALTPAERNIVKRIIPFYAFQKHAIKMAVSMPFAHPAKFRLLQELDQMVTEEEGGEGARPDWLHGSVQQSDGSYLAGGSANPFNSLSEGLPGLGQMLRPEAKVVFERATGRDSFSGRQFTKEGVYSPYYGSPDQTQAWTDENGVAHAYNTQQSVLPSLPEHLLSQIPLYQNLEKAFARGTPYDSSTLLDAMQGNALPPSDGESTYRGSQALANAFGMPTYNYDMDAYQQRQMENRQSALTEMMKLQAGV